MTNDVANERTTILAVYTTRRDAEMAQEHLENSGHRAFIRADDAGGMHPQLQQPHGVKLVVLESVVDEARALLDTAGLLPDRHERADAPPADTDEEADLTFSMDDSIFSATGTAYLVVFFLMVVAIVAGLVL
jgi:hypothetical protein